MNLRIVHSPSELKLHGSQFCLAMGFFDGVHIGHQRILKETLADANLNGAVPVVVTFDAHPSTIVAPAHVPPLLQTLAQRLRTIAAQGIETVLLYHFNQEFSRQPAETFVRRLAGELPGLRSVYVGANFHFGYRRSGNVAVLSDLGDKLGFAVHGVVPVTVAGEPVSSTRVREAVSAGKLGLVEMFLSHPYSLAGTVIHGDGLGRKLGFPTANLDIAGRVIPPPGVYVAEAVTPRIPGKAVVNIGVRPTLNHPVPEMRVEAHFPDFEGDLYGTELELAFHGKLRDERKFASLEALQAQIALDVKSAKTPPGSV